MSSGTSAPAATGATNDTTTTTATVLLVLLPIIFGSLLLVSVLLGIYQWYKTRQKEKERKSGVRAARLRRASSPAWITEPVPLVLRDLEAGRPDQDTGTLDSIKIEEAEARLARASSSRSYNLPRKPPPPYQP